MAIPLGICQLVHVSVRPTIGDVFSVSVVLVDFVNNAFWAKNELITYFLNRKVKGHSGEVSGVHQLLTT